jgi:hypothetical protein
MVLQHGIGGMWPGLEHLSWWQPQNVCTFFPALHWMAQLSWPLPNQIFWCFWSDWLGHQTLYHVLWLIKLPNLSERERDRICTMAFGLLILLLEQMNKNCWDFDDPTGPSQSSNTYFGFYSLTSTSIRIYATASDCSIVCTELFVMRKLLNRGYIN